MHSDAGMEGAERKCVQLNSEENRRRCIKAMLRLTCLGDHTESEQMRRRVGWPWDIGLRAILHNNARNM
jgi:hypothetical protein